MLVAGVNRMHFPARFLLTSLAVKPKLPPLVKEDPIVTMVE